MNLPNLKEARIRSGKKSTVYRNDYEIPQSIKDYGIGKKYYMLTYGCQMNEHDSEKIKGMLKSVGFSESDDINDADIIILNTCAIRENAHDKVFGFLGVLKHMKQSNPNLLIGLCGCMAQEEVVVNDILNKYKWRKKYGNDSFRVR